MSKSNKELQVSPATKSYSYTISRLNSGYFITRFTIEDSKVVNSEKVSEPDVLTICMSTLEKIIRKENGI